MAKTQPRIQDPDVKTTRMVPRLFSAIVLAGSAFVAVGLIIKFPNLRDNPAYLALVVLTPLLLGCAIAFFVSGLRRSVPRTFSVSLVGTLAVVMILDLIAFAGPLVIAGPQGRDSAPAFVSATPAHTATSIEPTIAIPTIAAPRTGQFDARPGVDTVSGRASLGQTSDGRLVLSLQSLHSANGPDLFVYLSTDVSPATADQVMHGYEVGRLKATTGTVNYELPATIDAGSYRSVVVYCKSFSVIFGYANLA